MVLDLGGGQLQPSQLDARPGGAPWVSEQLPAEIMLVVSTQRGMSTEAAEAIGSHPCSASFNEILVSSHLPPSDDYPKYRTNAFWGQYAASLGNLTSLATSPHHLDTQFWLSQARTLRDSFCARRPREVRDACGGVCVVALKLHVNPNPLNVSAAWHEGDDPTGYWGGKKKKMLELLRSPHVRTVIVQRDAVDAFCSIRRAQQSHDWHHRPQHGEATATAHGGGGGSGGAPPCNNETADADGFAWLVERRFAQARTALEGAGRAWLELPFAEYAADPEAGKARLLGSAGLRLPPPHWRSTCTMPWCSRYSWGA